mmetsp:Transcript_8708/g.16927  ORF Transcript_8708/g.16927 Transcript_8708/m.16927 type:complete len:214 (+) Transcript_8708:2675-3316(+)
MGVQLLLVHVLHLLPLLPFWVPSRSVHHGTSFKDGIHVGGYKGVQCAPFIVEYRFPRTKQQGSAHAKSHRALSHIVLVLHYERCHFSEAKFGQIYVLQTRPQQQVPRQPRVLLQRIQAHVVHYVSSSHEVFHFPQLQLTVSPEYLETPEVPPEVFFRIVPSRPDGRHRQQANHLPEEGDGHVGFVHDPLRLIVLAVVELTVWVQRVPNKLHPG